MYLKKIKCDKGRTAIYSKNWHIHIKKAIIKAMWAIFAYNRCQFRKCNLPKWNRTLLEAPSPTFAKMLTKRQLDGQRNDSIEQIIKELSKFIATKTQENSDNNAQNQTMGVAESQVSVGSGPRNLVLKLIRGRSRKNLSNRMLRVWRWYRRAIPNKVLVEGATLGILNVIIQKSWMGGMWKYGILHKVARSLKFRL